MMIMISLIYSFVKKVVIVHRGKYNYNISVNRLSHDVVTWLVDRDVSTAYC